MVALFVRVVPFVDVGPRTSAYRPKDCPFDGSGRGGTVRAAGRGGGSARSRMEYVLRKVKFNLLKLNAIGV
jgi:hypothetical protein